MAALNGTGGKNFWSPKQAASYYEVSLTTFYRYLRIPITKGGPPRKRARKNSAIKIPREKFIKWADAQED